MANEEVFNGLLITGSPIDHSKWISKIFAAGGKFHYLEEDGNTIVVYGIPGDEAPAPAPVKEEPKVEAPAPVEEVAVEAPAEDSAPAPEEEAPAPEVEVEAAKPAPVKRGRKPAVKAEPVVESTTPEVVEEN